MSRISVVIPTRDGGGWLVNDRGVLSAERPAVLVLTLMLLGAVILIATFVVSVLRDAGYGRA